MATKKLDQLSPTTSIAGTNIMHLQAVGGDNADKYVTFSNLIKSITDVAATGSVTADDYVLIREQGAGTVVKVLASDFLSEAATILTQSNTATTSDSVLWTDGADTFKGTVANVGDAAIRAQASTVSLGTTNEVVVVVDSVSKRISYEDLTGKLIDNISDIKTDVVGGDFLPVSDGTNTEKITVKNLIKDAVSILDLTTPSYAATAQVIVDDLADGNATRQSIQNILQKAPDDLLADGLAETGDKVLFVDGDDGVTKKDTLANAINTVTGLATVANLEEGDGAGDLTDLVTSALFSQAFKGFTTYQTTVQGETDLVDIKHGSLKLGGLIINIAIGKVLSAVNRDTREIDIDFTNPNFRSFSNTSYGTLGWVIAPTGDFDKMILLDDARTATNQRIRLDRDGNFEPPLDFIVVCFGD